MRGVRLAAAIVVVMVLASSVSAQATQTGVLGAWRDINPTAYLTPPANPSLDSVYMLSATDGWAVGEFAPTSDPTGGNQAPPVILHYDGTTWNLVPAPKNPTEAPAIPGGYALTSVSFGPPYNPISANDGWAVGFGFEGVAGPCGTPLSCAVALHWNGISWEAQLSGLTAPSAGGLTSVFMVSPTDVWAVGSDAAGSNGVFWHWTGVPGLGGGWSLHGTATGAPLLSVFMVGSAEGWAVGAGGVIYHYFGGAWAAFSSPVTILLRSLFMSSPTEGWAVGNAGTIIHFTGGTWNGPVSPGTTATDLLLVLMVSSTEGWAVGKSSTILHYSGGSWTRLPINQVPTLPATGFDFKSASFNTASDGWSVGSAGVVLHFDGSNWGTVTSPTQTSLTSISFGPPLSPINPNDAWAVGLATSSLPIPPAVTEPTIIHWNGFMWTKGIATGTLNDLFSVFMVSSGDVWAAGGGASTTASCAITPCPEILHFTGGSWNTLTPPPSSYVLFSIFMVGPNEGWAVGCSGAGAGCLSTPATGTGIILHYSIAAGVQSWGIFPTPSPTPLPPLTSVFMSSPNEGWAVGNSGTVLHYTVTGGVGTWNVVAVGGLPSTANLNSVFMLTPTSGWAVGGFPGPLPAPTGPLIIYWDGTRWSRVATPIIPGVQLTTPPILKSIYCNAPRDCWSVGAEQNLAQLLATIFHWDGVAWTHITLAPALIGLSFPAVLAAPPFLNSVYMLSPTKGWIVGSPFLSVAINNPLSTILRFEPFGGTTPAASTTTQTMVSTVRIFISPTSTTNTSATNTTTSSVAGEKIPGFPIESITVGILIGIASLILLRRRKLPTTRKLLLFTGGAPEPAHFGPPPTSWPRILP